MRENREKTRIDIEKLDLKGNKCRYENCRHYYNGKCLDKRARKDCLEIALAVLCIDMEDKHERISSKV